MKRIGLAIFIVGFIVLIGQGFIADGFLIPLMKSVYPNQLQTSIANGSGIALNVVGFSMVIAGMVVFLIYRKKR